MAQKQEPEPLEFSSLEEAWIDLSSNFEPTDFRGHGKEARNLFFAGAIAATLLIDRGQYVELIKDLRLHQQKLQEEFDL